jgi:hypothetical protein
MRSGFESKRNVVILSVLGIVMVGAGAYFVSTMFGGSPAPTAAAVPPAESAPQTGPRNENGHAAQKLPPLEKLDPTLHPEVMAGAEALEYSGKGRNIFSLVSAPVEIPKALGPVRTVAVVPRAPAGPPPPPPIDLKFFGYSAENGARKAFLLHGDDVFIAIEGDVVDHHYKVVKISPVSIQVTDLLYNNTQTLPLTQS